MCDWYRDRQVVQRLVARVVERLDGETDLLLQRQADYQTDWQGDTQTARKRGTERDRQTSSETDRHVETKENGYRDRLIGRQSSRETDRQTNKTSPSVSRTKGAGGRAPQLIIYFRRTDRSFHDPSKMVHRILGTADIRNP